jgi:Gas vesicle protein
MEPRRSIQPAATNLVDVLDRVLDKGLVVAGDIRISLANVELITIRIRLLVCSIDKAQEIGLDWWRRDSFLSSTAAEDEAVALRARVEELERRVLGEDVSGPRSSAPRTQRRQPGTRR